MTRRPPHEGPEVFIIGVSGAVGAKVARRLVSTGSGVRGLVRTSEQRAEWSAAGVDVHVADLAAASVDELSRMFHGADAIVYAAGSNGGARDVTDAIDGEGVAKTVAAARRSGVERLLLVSVMPEAWRERQLSDDEEHYFATKKRTEVLLARSELAWVILRPSLLVDDPGTGTVSLGPVQLHRRVSRDDVAAVVVELLLEPGVHRKILELDTGPTPIEQAVQAAVSS